MDESLVMCKMTASATDTGQAVVVVGVATYFGNRKRVKIDRPLCWGVRIHPSQETFVARVSKKQISR